jgi:hypothetical protein
MATAAYRLMPLAQATPMVSASVWISAWYSVTVHSSAGKHVRKRIMQEF